MNEREKIALVCPYDYGTPGGVRDQVLGLRNQLEEWGYSVKLFFPGPARGLESPDVFFLGRGFPAPGPTQSWGTITIGINSRNLEEILQQEQFDILQLNEPLVPFLPRTVLKIARERKLPTTCVATLHAAWPENYSQTVLSSLATSFLKASKIESMLDGVVAVSAVARECWQPLFPNSQIEIIPNGIDLNRFHPRVRPLRKYKDGKINLLFVGRFDKRKGARHLLEALTFIRRENLRLIFVGDGPGKSDLEAQVKEQGLGNCVEFVGVVSDRMLPRYFASADIFCAPATGFESFGVVLLQAMASAKPIVCFANKGYAYVMRNYPFKKGLVQPGDDNGLAEALTILAEDKDLRKKLGEWGLAEVQQYSWPVVAKQFLAKIERLKNN